MRWKIAILALVGLAAGVAGTVGTRMLVEPPQAASARGGEGTQAVRIALTSPNHDACRELARKVSRGSTSDARLRRLIMTHPGCNAMVIDSESTTTRSSSTPRTVTIPAIQTASTQTSPTILSQLAQRYEAEEDDHEHEAEGAFEEAGREEDD